MSTPLEFKANTWHFLRVTKEPGKLLMEVDLEPVEPRVWMDELEELMTRLEGKQRVVAYIALQDLSQATDVAQVLETVGM